MVQLLEILKSGVIIRKKLKIFEDVVTPSGQTVKHTQCFVNSIYYNKGTILMTEGWPLT